MWEILKRSAGGAINWLKRPRKAVSHAAAQDSIARRLLIYAALVIAVGFLVGGILLSRLFYWHAITTTERQLEEILSYLAFDVALEQSTAGPVEVGLKASQQDSAFTSPFSGRYWQVSLPDGRLLRSDSLLDFQLSVPPHIPPGAVVHDTRPGPEGQVVLQRHKALFYRDYGLVLRLSAAVDISDVRALHRSFNLYLLIALVGLALVLVGGLVLQIRFALRPLRRAQASLQAVRIGEKPHLESDFPREILPLAEEINALIDDNRTLVERARKQVGNLAHGLKTPLSVLMNAARGEPQDAASLAATLVQQSAAIENQVQRHLALARSMAASQQRGIRTNVATVTAPLARTLAKIYSRKALLIHQQIAADIYFVGEHQDLQDMLGNLLENACKWARTEVLISAQRQDQDLVLCVEDDGPGVADDLLVTLGQRGKRLDEQTPGTGLGLSIVKDLAEIYKGDLRFDRSSLGGLRAQLRFPAARASQQSLG